MYSEKIIRYILIAVFLIMVIPSASAADINIVDVFSDIDSADITLYSNTHLTNITLQSDLIFKGKVLESKQFTIDEIQPNTAITKVLYWGLTSPEEGYYRTSTTVSMDGSPLETRFYNFSYGRQALPRLFIKDIIPDSAGISVILAPRTSLSGSEPVLTDVEYMLVDQDTVINLEKQNRITVVQATPLSNDWNVLLEKNHQYSVRVKARISSPHDAVIVQSEDFTAMDDARITELFRDETGASITVLGMSQVPFNGDIIFTVMKDGITVEEIRKPSPVLVSGDDETVEVTWSSILPPGIYNLSVRVMGNDGDELDKWTTIIESEPRRYEDTPAPTPTQTPGFTTAAAVFSLIVFYLVTGWRNHRNG